MQGPSKRVAGPSQTPSPTQHTTSIRDENPRPHRISNPRPQQLGGCRLRSETSQLPGSVSLSIYNILFIL